MTHPTSKGENNPGQGDHQGSKAGMGIEGPTNAHALLIGVGRCQYSAWSLPVTVLDTLELRKTLADPTLCAYPDEHIRLLNDEAATREGILAALAALAKTAEADPNATLLVYYSGHGWRQTGDGGERYFLIPSDVKPHELTSSALPAEDFIQGLRSLRSRRVLVMIDTCHASRMADAKDPVAASIPKGFTEVPLPKALVEELSAGKGRVVFLSCGEAQSSWIAPDEGGLSIFTHHLLAALRGAGSAEMDQAVTVSSLMKHLGRAVPESARRIGQEQTPFFKFESEEFAVAWLRGGKGLPSPAAEASSASKKPEDGGSSFRIGSIASGRDTILGHEVKITRRGD